MSEEENINPSTNDTPQPTENKDISEPPTINYQPSTNMETHHPHHITIPAGIFYVVFCSMLGFCWQAQLFLIQSMEYFQ